jgi:hypothetical protein
MRPILACLLLFIATDSISYVAGQGSRRGDNVAMQNADAKSTDGQIEVKTDRFSGVTTAILNPQVILDKPDHHLTISIETKLGEKKFSDWEKDMVSARANLVSLLKSPIDFGDQQLHLLIDGKPLDLGECVGGSAESTSEEMRRQQGYRIRKSFLSIFNRSAVEQLSKANRIEMRFGTIEQSLSPSTVTNLREYANQVLALHKTARERKP